jgi:hypothetical protein
MRSILITMKLFFVFFALEATACDFPIATTTVYYVPVAKKICGAYGKACDKFIQEVHMQGSGKIWPNKIIRTIAQEKQEDISNCATTKGSMGICLIPYISVAADSNFYNGGDVISMPALRGQKVKLSDDTYFIHPGYFLVHDVGGMINGQGRFDIFTGDLNLRDENNSFGYKGEPQTRMYSESTCEARKKVERIAPTDRRFSAAKAAIAKALNAANYKSEVLGN